MYGCGIEREEIHMTTVNDHTNSCSPVSNYYTSQGVTGTQGRDYSSAILQESNQVQQFSPEQIHDLQSFYNKALSNIDTVRFPNLPQLSPGSGDLPAQNNIVSLNDRKVKSESGKTVLDPGETGKNLEKTIKDYKGYVYSDPGWGDRHKAGKFKEGEYMFQCEGGSRYEPLRSGKEMELYNKIKEHIKNHDISNPAEKITPEMILQWSLDVNKKDGKVCIEDAFLTCHNVMRVVGRTDSTMPENLRDGDPVKEIYKDLKGVKTGRDGKDVFDAKNEGLYSILEARYDKNNKNNKNISPDMGYGNLLFAPDNKYSPFKAYADNGNASAGCAYHMWVGALASSLFGKSVADGMVAGEGNGFKKGTNFLDNVLSGQGFKVDNTVTDLVQRELPWGYTGSALGENVTNHSKTEHVPPGYENYPVK